MRLSANNLLACRQSSLCGKTIYGSCLGRPFQNVSLVSSARLGQRNSHKEYVPANVSNMRSMMPEQTMGQGRDDVVKSPSVASRGDSKWPTCRFAPRACLLQLRHACDQILRLSECVHTAIGIKAAQLPRLRHRHVSVYSSSSGCNQTRASRDRQCRPRGKRKASATGNFPNSVNENEPAQSDERYGQ